MFLRNGSNQSLHYFITYGKAWYDQDKEKMVDKRRLQRKAYKESSVRPFKLFEEQLLRDVDQLIEGNYDNPVVAL